MMASLDGFVFELRSLPYAATSRRTEYKHASAARVGERDAYQFTGPGDDSTALSGCAMAEMQDGEASLDELRTLAAAGGAYALIDGGGYYHGSWVILGIDDRRTDFFPDGKARRIEFTIDLRRVDTE